VSRECEVVSCGNGKLVDSRFYYIRYANVSCTESKELLLKITFIKLYMYT